MGPTLIFDKSVLQGLSSDEAAWLDQFFTTNITPIFYVETLADLEKEMRAGRTAEELVGSLAYKTPDFSSKPNVHHRTLLQAELTGSARVPLTRRPIVSHGEIVRLGGETGIILKRTPEEDALARWIGGDFLQLERQRAKRWRRALTSAQLEETYQTLQHLFSFTEKPSSLADAKSFADAFIEGLSPRQLLDFGMQLLSIAPPAQQQVVTRWQAAGEPPISTFAPYYRFLIRVDLFFYLSIASDLIARTRPSNMVDIAYLYYLPFCMVFSSNDKLHAKTAPLFLEGDQSFVSACELKADLHGLDEHYSRLPDAIKDKGMLAFASHPPLEHDFLVSRLWDKHLPGWRMKAAEPSASEEDRREIISRVNRLRRGSAARPEVAIEPDNVDTMLIERQVRQAKGKWKRFDIPGKG